MEVPDPHRPLFGGEPLRFVFHVTSMTENMVCFFTVYDEFGNAVIAMDTRGMSFPAAENKASGPCFSCDIHELLMVPGRYRINVADLAYSDGVVEDHLEGAASFDVEPGLYLNRPLSLEAEPRSFYPIDGPFSNRFNE